ncbi:MAG: hypothetical protein KGJ13_01135 [Patescibacteria group bacterium]|nr:hypothetical protein [Patescibacteria group bacterium]
MRFLTFGRRPRLAGKKVQLLNGEIIRFSLEDLANPELQAGLQAGNEGRGGHTEGDRWDSPAFQLGWWLYLFCEGRVSIIPFTGKDVRAALEQSGIHHCGLRVKA